MFLKKENQAFNMKFFIYPSFNKIQVKKICFSQSLRHENKKFIIVGILGVIDNWATYVIIVFVLIMCCACAGLGLLFYVCFSFERNNFHLNENAGGVCWIAAGGEVEEDEGSALQEAEKRRRQDEKAEKILQAYNDGYGQCN